MQTLRMKNLTSLAATALGILLSSPVSGQELLNENLKPLAWLVGQWEAKMEDGNGNPLRWTVEAKPYLKGTALDLHYSGQAQNGYEFGAGEIIYYWQPETRTIANFRLDTMGGHAADTLARQGNNQWTWMGPWYDGQGRYWVGSTEITKLNENACTVLMRSLQPTAEAAMPDLKLTFTRAGRSADEQELLRLESQWNEALIKVDARRLDRIFADELIMTDSNGGVLNKKQTIALATSGDEVVKTAVSDEFKIQFQGDTAILNLRFTSKETYKGQDASGSYRCTDIWRKQAGAWRCVASHGTRIKPSSANAEAELIQLENEWNDALVKADVQKLDQIYAGEFILTNADGEVWDKAKCLALVKSGEDVFSSATTDQIKVSLHGEMAVVTGRMTAKETLKGKDVSGTIRFTDTWCRKGAAWRCVASHGTKIKD